MQNCKIIKNVTEVMIFDSRILKYLQETGSSAIKGIRYFRYNFKEKPIDISITYTCDCKDCAIHNHRWKCRYLRGLLLMLAKPTIKDK